MSVSGIGQNYDYLGTATNYMQKKTPVKEVISKTVEQPVNLSISDEGKNALRKMVSKFESASDPESLVDITQITIDKSLSEKERKLEYIRQIKNPYCFRVGNIVVKCSYSEDGVTLD